MFLCFDFVGYTIGDSDLEIIEGLEPEPQIIICRMNVFEEVIIINRYKKDEFGAISSVDLEKCYLKGVEMMRKDEKVVKLYRNYRRGMRVEEAYFSDEEAEEQIKNLEYHEEINKQN